MPHPIGLETASRQSRRGFLKASAAAAGPAAAVRSFGAFAITGMPQWIAPAGEPINIPAGQRQLFLDDYVVADVAGLQKTMHQPEKRGAAVWPDRPWELSLQTRSAPAWDEHAKIYKLWMITSVRQGSEPDPNFGGVTYAESTDGVHWTKLIQRQREYQGSRENNFLEFETNSMENALYHAEDPDPNRRYKGLLGALGRRPAASPDGIHWQRLDVPEIPSGDESNLSYDRGNDTFIATLKTDGSYGRVHGIWTSNDFKTWTNTNVVFHADENDQRLAVVNIRARLAHLAGRGGEAWDAADEAVRGSRNKTIRQC